jgi:hypothetical protein
MTDQQLLILTIREAGRIIARRTRMCRVDMDVDGPTKAAISGIQRLASPPHQHISNQLGRNRRICTI